VKRVIPKLTPLIAVAALALTGCRGEMQVKAPPVDDEDEENLVGSRTAYEDVQTDAEALDDQYGKRAELPPKSEPKEKCKGKGKNRTCAMVDPKPGVTAAYGTRKLLDGFRWGMSPDAVMAVLTKQIEAEYDKLQAETADPVKQDKNRDWKRHQLDTLAEHHVYFETRAHHKWGVSAIAGDYVDDENEQMIWVQTNTLKKFYFFKDDELWRVVYAYSNQHWPGKTHEEVHKEKFEHWFGVSPTEEVQIDEKTQAATMRYKQWKSDDGEFVRAFDMRAVHGVSVLAVINKESEDRYGIRLPNPKRDESFSDDVGDVLGGSDICYDEEGNMVEDAAKCKEIRGY
jgi:hypothetical protein